mmetsp:Transcript_12227/g.50530  ORF Transcript_12227/g.50530 Transcript_12227/m.50530 type:complete len:214 (-) Transcript_12227:1320-1961(-)
MSRLPFFMNLIWFVAWAESEVGNPQITVFAFWKLLPQNLEIDPELAFLSALYAFECETQMHFCPFAQSGSTVMPSDNLSFKGRLYFFLDIILCLSASILNSSTVDCEVNTSIVLSGVHTSETGSVTGRWNRSKSISGSPGGFVGAGVSFTSSRTTSKSSTTHFGLSLDLPADVTKPHNERVFVSGSMVAWSLLTISPFTLVVATFLNPPFPRA